MVENDSKSTVRAAAPPRFLRGRSPEIGPGDLLLAFDQLAPTSHADRLAIARSLGLAAKERLSSAVPSDRSTGKPKKPPPPVDDDVPPPEAPRAKKAQPRTASSSSEQAADRPIVATRLRELRAARRVDPEWLRDVEPLETQTVAAAPRLPEPLLEPQRTRSILGVALATQDGEGRIDLREIVQRTARGEALLEVPHRPAPTLARGVQLLLDRSDAMLPFHADLYGIRNAVAALLSEEAISVLWFRGSPLPGAGPKSSWTPYAERHLPPSGTRVIAVSDLGVGRPRLGYTAAPAHDWQELHALLNARDCPLLVLSPYNEKRCPPSLRDRLRILHWSRTTTAADAARATR